MTLSRWLRDYLYIPLGGNQRGHNRALLNLFLTMLIGGLWHGAAWTFIVWGALHGSWLVGERSSRSAPTAATQPPPARGRPTAAAEPDDDLTDGRGQPVLTGAPGPEPVSGSARARAVGPPPRAGGGRRRRRRPRRGGRGARVGRPAGSVAVARTPITLDGAFHHHPPVARPARTFNVVCLGWVFFRSPSGHRGAPEERPGTAGSSTAGSHARALGGQPDARHARRAARAHPSRDLRDAGARDLPRVKRVHERTGQCPAVEIMVPSSRMPTSSRSRARLILRVAVEEGFPHGPRLPAGDDDRAAASVLPGAGEIVAPRRVLLVRAPMT